MAPTAMLVALAKTAATVLEAWFPPSAVPLVVSPEPTVTEQRTPGDMAALAAVNVTAAPTFVESEPAAVNVVDPQPLLLIEAGTTVKLGTTTLIVSPTSTFVLVKKK
jgi:hypothetical protein